MWNKSGQTKILRGIELFFERGKIAMHGTKRLMKDGFRGIYSCARMSYDLGIKYVAPNVPAKAHLLKTFKILPTDARTHTHLPPARIHTDARTHKHTETSVYVCI